MNTSIKPSTGFSQDVQTLAKTPEGKESSSVAENKVGSSKVPISVTNRMLQNAAIIESSLKYSQSASDQPQSLVLKTAFQGINEALKASTAIDSNVTSVDDAYDSGVDMSPEATADRIVSFSTQFFDSYRSQNPEMSDEESLTSFIDIISSGIDQGFDEAKDILESLSVLEGDISSNIDKTYELVQLGLQSFMDSFSESDDESDKE
ncbi:MAG: DUF5610 domain-containing protein [Colwellia sp.]